MLASQFGMARVVFGEFELDVAGCMLLRGTKKVSLELRAMDMLCYLASRPGELVYKQELVEQVWQVKALSPNVLANTAAKLRRALGQSATTRRPLETVRGRGYRFHADAIQQAMEGAAGQSAAQARLVRPARFAEPWVGRADLLRTIDDALDRVSASQGQLLLLVGDAGIGKTRTIAEFAVRATERGIRVWHGAAYDGAGAPPYWPWVEALRCCYGDLGPVQFRRHAPDTCVALPWLLPEMFSQVRLERSPEFTRFQLFDELSRLFTSASERGPCAIALDDLHWADAGTLELLDQLSRALCRQPLVLVASLRERELEGSAQHRAAFARLSKVARRLELTGLSSTEIAELVGQLHGQQAVEDRSVATLAKRTQGNPFFVIQLLDLALQRGLPLNATSLRALEVPPAVRLVIEQRIHALGKNASTALMAAAVVGQQFDLSVLGRLLQVPAAQVLAWLEPARRLGVLVPEGTTPGRFGFGHALMRETLYEQLSLADAGALHRRLAELMFESGSDARDVRHMGELARHSLLSVPLDYDRCLSACAAGAAAARAVGGFDAAANLLLRAERRLLAEGGDATQLAELTLWAGTDQLHAGDFEDAWQTLAKGAVGLRGEGLQDARLLARFVFRLLDCLQVSEGDEVLARTLLERALLLLGEQAPDLCAVLLAHRAEMAFELDFTERAELLAEAERLAEDQGSVEGLLEVIHCAVNLRDPTRTEFCLNASDRLRAMVAERPQSIPATRRDIWLFSADLTEYVCMLAAGDFARADRIIARALAGDVRARPVALNVVTEMMRAGRALGEGRLVELEQVIARMRGLAEQSSGGLGNIGWYYTILLAEARGSRPSLRALLSGCRLKPPTPRHRATVLLSAASFAARMGLGLLARALLTQVSAAELRRMPREHGDLGCLCSLAETYYRLGDVRSAKRLELQLAPHAHANAVGPALEYHGSVEHYLGLLAATSGNVEQARERLVRAEVENLALGMPLQVARTRAVLEDLDRRRK